MSAEPPARSLAEAAAKRTLDAEQRVRARAAQSSTADGASGHVRRRRRARAASAARSSTPHAELRAEIEALRVAHAARRRGCRSASAPATRRCAPGCAAALDENQRQREEIAAAARGARARARPRPRAGARPPRGPQMSSWPAPARDAALARRRRRVRDPHRPAHRVTTRWRC